MFQKISGMEKKFMDKRKGGGNITIFRQFFCLIVPKNFVLFSVSKKLGYRKILCIRRGYHCFPLKIVCLTMPIKFVGEPFSISENFWYRKVSCIEGGITVFSKTFRLTGPKRKTLRGSPSVYQKFSDMEKNLWMRGGITIFRPEVSVPRCRKAS